MISLTLDLANRTVIPALLWCIRHSEFWCPLWAEKTSRRFGVRSEGKKSSISLPPSFFFLFPSASSNGGNIRVLFYRHSFRALFSCLWDHPTLPFSTKEPVFVFWRGGSSGVDNTCISKNTLFQTNKIYLLPAFYPSFTLVMFTSRISLTLNLPFN